MSAGGGALGMGGLIVQNKAIDQQRDQSLLSLRIENSQERLRYDEIKRRSAVNQEIARKQFANERGEQSTAFAASGISGSSGSALRAMAEQEMIAKREIMEMRRQSEIEMKQSKLKQTLNKRNQDFTKSSAETKRMGSFFNFGSSAFNASGAGG